MATDINGVLSDQDKRHLLKEMDNKYQNFVSTIKNDEIAIKELPEAFDKLVPVELLNEKTYNTLEAQYTGLTKEELAFDITKADGEEDFSQW